jgi:tRNA (guanine-N7-)-methyltransferase
MASAMKKSITPNTDGAPKRYRLRSFVRRDGRRTPAQERAHALLWPLYGLNVELGVIDYQQVFGRTAPCFLEIGFGSGQSLLALAAAHPDKNFIGVETHKPGIGALCLGIEENALTNIRVYYQDVIDVLEKGIPNESLDGVQIFFPDPWQKRRHHQRRLIQSEFVRLIVSKLKKGGSLHLATDWEDYAKHMMQVVTAEPALTNLAGVNQFSERSPYRPVLTKFERRAGRELRSVWELQLQK